jgi:hypothetical protein
MLIFSPQELQRLIDCYPHDPCLQRAIPTILEIGDVGEDVYECVLNHILHVFLISDVSHTDAGKASTITGIELPGCSLVAFLQPLHQALFLISNKRHVWHFCTILYLINAVISKNLHGPAKN